MASNNKTKYALLGILCMISGSGYDIKKMCDSSISYFWNENYSHIYSVLKKLELEGLVISKIEKNGARPPKSIYSITDKGKKELIGWLAAPIENTPPRSELLLKLSFSREVPVETTLAMLRQENERIEKIMNEYSKIEKRLTTSQELLDDNGLPYWLSTVKLGQYQLDAKKKWLNETIELFKKLDKNKKDGN